MKSELLWSWGAVLALATSGCGGGEAGPSAACTLPEEPRFEFTEIELEVDRSNRDCPEIAPSALNTDAIAEQGVCEQAIVDCVIELTCEYEGVSIRGRMAESGDGLVGRFDFETPVTCLYAVKAKWRELDGG